MADVWECYGHGVPGIAIVSASSRATALQACFEWLGWKVGVAFKKPDRYVLWANCGGSEEQPVLYAEDGVHFAALERRVTASEDGAEQDLEQDSQNGRIAITEYWEDRL
ncbi:MAG: hypothetical protein JXR84_08430 [Anaerolineae bacterium]|nr:hypothetical protein [Anaerolineae bacterium]